MKRRLPVIEAHGFSDRDFVGGDAALDFVNTVTGRDELPRDWLDSYERMLDWARRTQLLPERNIKMLGKRARHSPAAAGSAAVYSIGSSKDDVSQTARHASAASTADETLFDRLVGTWDVVYEIFDKDGKTRTYRGQVIYGWILDGQALQEIWTSDSHNKEAKPYGTAIGFHDGKRNLWTLVWIYPAQGSTLSVSGAAEEGRIVLTGRDQNGANQRWEINDIQGDSFVSHFEISTDDGKTWRALGVNHMRRHRA